jgi:hypothetical protein
VKLKEFMAKGKPSLGRELSDPQTDQHQAVEQTINFFTPLYSARADLHATNGPLSSIFGSQGIRLVLIQDVLRPYFMHTQL